MYSVDVAETPQYRGWDQDKAVDDYYKRIRDHVVHYEPVEETDYPSIRIKNVSGLHTVSPPVTHTRKGRRQHYGQCERTGQVR